jgi:hypothetical protein
VVEAHLLALLHDPVRLDRAELVSVRGYLFAAGGEREALDRRRCQLAAALAHLFDEYAGSRAVRSASLLCTSSRSSRARTSQKRSSPRCTCPRKCRSYTQPARRPGRRVVAAMTG